MLSPVQTLGGQCMQPASDGTPWVLASLDHDCVRSDGSLKLDFMGIQYYNAAEAVCCGGGNTNDEMTTSITQHFKNLALGWEAVTAADMDDASNPWHQYRWYPGPWAEYTGFNASRLVLGKPGCKGCAGSDYQDTPSMLSLLDTLHNMLRADQRSIQQAFGGLLFWDLCRLFGSTGNFCVASECQPSWAGQSVQQSLQTLRDKALAV
eukprot:c3687_g1_i2.p2 GENE.c3687_g1_i2~~c3687_g1_i2.p2  ORF type:complete len:207 (+),score=53.59 c3687_g1_i2:1039-1659(+)